MQIPLRELKVNISFILVLVDDDIFFYIFDNNSIADGKKIKGHHSNIDSNN